MTNYEALQQLSQKELVVILDQIFCTGLNRAALPTQSDDPFGLETSENPFTEEWLNAPAEEAVMNPIQPDGDTLLLNAFSASVFAIAFGGEPPATLSQGENGLQVQLCTEPGTENQSSDEDANGGCQNGND